MFSLCSHGILGVVFTLRWRPHACPRARPRFTTASHGSCPSVTSLATRDCFLELFRHCMAASLRSQRAARSFTCSASKLQSRRTWESCSLPAAVPAACVWLRASWSVGTSRRRHVIADWPVFMSGGALCFWWSLCSSRACAVPAASTTDVASGRRSRIPIARPCRKSCRSRAASSELLCRCRRITATASGTLTLPRRPCHESACALRLLTWPSASWRVVSRVTQAFCHLWDVWLSLMLLVWRDVLLVLDFVLRAVNGEFRRYRSRLSSSHQLTWSWTVSSEQDTVGVSTRPRVSVLHWQGSWDQPPWNPHRPSPSARWVSDDLEPNSLKSAPLFSWIHLVRALQHPSRRYILCMLCHWWSSLSLLLWWSSLSLLPWWSGLSLLLGNELRLVWLPGPLRTRPLVIVFTLSDCHGIFALVPPLKRLSHAALWWWSSPCWASRTSSRSSEAKRSWWSCLGNVPVLSASKAGQRNPRVFGHRPARCWKHTCLVQPEKNRLFEGTNTGCCLRVTFELAWSPVSSCT